MPSRVWPTMVATAARPASSAAMRATILAGSGGHGLAGRSDRGTGSGLSRRSRLGRSTSFTPAPGLVAGRKRRLCRGGLTLAPNPAARRQREADGGKPAVGQAVHRMQRYRRREQRYCCAAQGQLDDEATPRKAMQRQR
ncbi:MAG: hypothetical protein U1E35_08360 [Rhodospirillales bacterium]